MFAHRNDVDVRQTHYASREDCEMDWGDAESCSQNSYGYSENSHSGGYVGPRYYWDRDLHRPVAILPDGQTRVINNSRLNSFNINRGPDRSVGSYSRGGFGSVSRGFTAGG